MTKACTTCGVEKPAEDYSPLKNGYLGRAARCKACATKAAIAKYWSNPELYRARSASYERAKRRRQGIPPKSLDPNPGRGAIYGRVYQAARRGSLPKLTLCEDCLQEKRLHAHHDDYSKPLAVRWLCGSCHKIHHLNKRRAA